MEQPEKERAFTGKKEHFFAQSDIIFDISIPYISYSLILGFVFYAGLIPFALYCLVVYCNARIKLAYTDFPLSISKNVQKQLKLLNYSIPLHQQLLKLDELIKNAKWKFENQLFIIENDSGNLFVVVLPVKYDIIKTYKCCPFKIIQISKIQNITPKGIYYSHFSVEPWPTKLELQKKAYANWLHEKLIEISQSYRDVVDREELHKLVQEEEAKYLERRPYLAFAENTLTYYLLWLRYAADTMFDNPVPIQQIARFRLQQKRHSNKVNRELQETNKICTICQEDFELNQEYAIWPCSSTPPHPFHLDCLLDSFRRNINCPNCRGPADFTHINFNKYTYINDTHYNYFAF